MTFHKNAFVNFVILTVAFTEVAAWTIDLPEVRKFLFEKNEKYKKYSKNEYEDYLNSDQKFYSNIEGNSKHNSEDYKHEHYPHENEKYADEYGYHTSYMEKKVHNIVRDGGSYLEGLRRSLEDYSMFLETCNRRNSSMQNLTLTNSTIWRPQYDPPSNGSFSSPFPPSSNSSIRMLNFQNYDNSTVPLRPKNSTDSRRSNMRNRNNRRLSCEEATESREQVRRYADLAFWATGRLQDLAYAKKYQKELRASVYLSAKPQQLNSTEFRYLSSELLAEHQRYIMRFRCFAMMETDEQEENELILKLAWFLDRLAYLSGYEPDYKDYNYYEPRGTQKIPTTSPTAITLVPSSDELTREMMDCLKRKSSEPATERCRYPMEIPDLMRQMMGGGTTESSRPSDFNNVVPMNTPSDSVSDQSSEILIAADNSAPNNIVTPSRITKRSTDYTYYYPSKPLHELTYPVPIVKLIKHRLSNIKSVVKTIVERRLAHLAEKKDEKHHFEKRSIDDTNVQTSNYIIPLSNNPKPIVKSVEKRPLDVASLIVHYPVSDVSVINTKSFRKRSIDERRLTSNHVNRLSNYKSIVKSVGKGPVTRKKFEHFLSSTKLEKRSSKYPVSEIKSIKKRFTEDPFSKLANYYIKYKVWDNSNPIYQKKNFNKKSGVFDVKNHLNEPKTIHKRSLFKNKVIHLHVPKPLQVVRTYIHGHRKNHIHSIHKPKILSHLQKLHDLKHKKIEKKHKITKRSLHYEHMYLPRNSEDPQGDISYYIKNKEGTNFNPDLLQAGQVRLGLEQVFQTGNIEVVRRFGANYNPLNPAPFYAGVLASMADA